MTHDISGERIAEMMRSNGIMRGQDGAATPLTTSHRTIMPRLIADTRLSGEFCELCLRVIRPQRRRWLRPGVAVCRHCANILNDPKDVDRWLALDREVRRLRIINEIGIDPVTEKRAELITELITYWADVDGLPAGTTTERLPNRIAMLGRPLMYWDAAPHRPRP